MNSNEMGKFIKKLREEKQWTQEQLAEKIPVSRESVSKWERGVNTPDISCLNVLAKTLNVTTDELLSGEKNTKKNVALELYKERNKINKKLKLSIFLIIIILVLFLIYYFINQYKSIEIYTVSGKSDNFILNNGLIMKTREKIYFNLGNFENNNYDIYKMEIIYNDQVIYTSDDDNILIYDYFGYEEVFDFSKLNEIFKNLFLKIYFEDKEEILKLCITRDYINDNLLFNDYKSVKKNNNANLNKENQEIINLIKNKFKEEDNTYVFRQQYKNGYSIATFLPDTKVINLQVYSDLDDLLKEYIYDMTYKTLDYKSNLDENFSFNNNCDCISKECEQLENKNICNYFFESINNLLA